MELTKKQIDEVHKALAALPKQNLRQIHAVLCQLSPEYDIHFSDGFLFMSQTGIKGFGLKHFSRILCHEGRVYLQFRSAKRNLLILNPYPDKHLILLSPSRWELFKHDLRCMIDRLFI